MKAHSDGSRDEAEAPDARRPIPNPLWVITAGMAAFFACAAWLLARG